MEFDNQYLTYQEYVDLGGTLEITPFNLLEFKARKKIDERTFGRLIGKGQDYQEVKACVYDLIKSYEKYDKYDKAVSSGISSENTDGYSVTYGTLGSLSDDAKNTELEDIIDADLSTLVVDGVRVIWRGI